MVKAWQVAQGLRDSAGKLIIKQEPVGSGRCRPCCHYTQGTNREQGNKMTFKVGVANGTAVVVVDGCG